MRQNRIFLKSISLALSFSILYSQLLYAADVRDLLQQAKAGFELEDQRRAGGVEPDLLQQATTQSESVVDNKNALQDLQGMNFSLTTQNGDILKYVGDKLKEVQRQDGTLLQNITLDSQGMIINADLKLSDGSIQLFQDGKVLAYETPDGTQVFYENGQIQKTVKDSIETVYSYTDSTITLENDKVKSVYDKTTQKLLSSLDKETNTTLLYTDGLLDKMIDSLGKTYSFNKTTTPENKTLITAPTIPTDTFTDSQGNTFTQVLWDASGNMTEAIVKDAQDNTYSFKNKALQSITLKDGSLLTGITLDAQGKILNTTLKDTAGTVFTFSQGKLSKVTYANGYVFQAPVFDAQKKLLSSKILDPQGNEYTVSNGVLTNQIKLKSGSILSNIVWNASNKIQSATLKDLSNNQYFYTNSTVTKITLSTGETLTNLKWGIDNHLADALYTDSQNTQVNYTAGKITKVLLSDGSLLTGIAWDTDKTVKNATLTNSNGTYLYQNKQLTKFTSTTGLVTTFTYTATRVFSTDSNGNKNEYLLNKSLVKITKANGNVYLYNTTGTYKGYRSEETISGIRYTYTYTTTNNLITAKKKNTKTNVVTTVADPATLQGASLINRVDTLKNLTLLYRNIPAFTQTPVTAFTKPWIGLTSKTLSTVTIPDFKILKSQAILDPTESLSFKSMLYNADKSLSQIELKDGTSLSFESGLLKEAHDKDGNLISFNFTQSALGNVLDSSITQNNLKTTYNDQGKLSSVQVDDMTIRYLNDGTSIDSIQKQDGTTIKHITFDDEGQIKDCVITTPTGEERTYQDNHLVKILQPDEVELGFTFDAALQKSILDTILTQNKLSYTFEYQPETIKAILDDSFIPKDDTIIQMDYDTSFNLKKTIKQNNEIIEYTSTGKIDKIITPIDSSTTTKTFGYFADGAYTVTEGDTQSFYDKNNNLQKVLIFKDANTTLEVDYQYGKIREIYKVDKDNNKTLTFKYSYTTDTDGKELTQIQDLEEKTLKTYKDELLLTSLDQEMSVLSTYSYYPDVLSQGIHQVSSVKVTRLGRELHTYRYAYDNDNTLVTDEEGVIRTYNKDQKLIYLDRGNEKFSYSYSKGADSAEIVEEKLTSKTLLDGSVLHYADGSLVKIDNRLDGSVIDNITISSGGGITKATATLLNGTKEIFSESGLLEEILPDNTHLYFTEGRLTKAISPQGKESVYSYEYNSQGSVTAINLKTDGVDLKYTPLGNLSSLKLLGIPSPEDVLKSTTHTYIGEGQGSYSYDNDFNTAQVGGKGGLYSEHTFTSPQNIEEVTYKLTANSFSSGDSDNGSDARTFIEVKDATTGIWSTVSGTYLSQNHHNGGGGGSTAFADANLTTKTVSLSNVIAIRAVAYAGAFSNSGGGTGGTTAIWDIQFKLADQSSLSFSKTATNLLFQGPKGIINYDLNGQLIPGYTPSLGTQALALQNSIDDLILLPHKTKVAGYLPQDYTFWMDVLKSEAVSSSLVTSQEYSASGVLETQTKADHTTTLFENNKPSKVLNGKGEVMIEYSYDNEGNPSKVYLKSARDTLPDEILAAQESIDSQRAASLLELAKQKNLSYQSIEAQTNTQKSLLTNQLVSLQSQYDNVSGLKASGKAAKSQKGDALNQINSAMGDVRGAIADIDAQAADGYASLDSQVKALSDKIEADSNTAFTALAAQEEAMKKEILRQEVSPIVYDYYRRILGRDPSSAEYQSWIDKIDYNSGKIITGYTPEVVTTPGASFSLDGTGDSISIPDSEDFNFGSQDFTIDFWINPSVNQDANLWCQKQDGSNYIALKREGNFLIFIAVKDGVAVARYKTTTSFNPSVGQWSHVALVRQGSGFSMNLNGIAYGLNVLNPIGANAIPNLSAPIEIGSNTQTSEVISFLKASIDEFRVSKGIARWTTTFTPPTAISTPDNNTTLLLRVPNPGEALQDVSLKNHTLTLIGDTKPNTATYKYERSKTTQKPITVAVTQALSDFLNNKAELTDRKAYVASIKSKVAFKINAYLAKSETDKQAFASSLGLLSTDLIALSSTDAAKILTWLDSRSLHFGQSAFLSLESLLDQKGISYAREDIAEKAILIDILTGVISPLDDGDLVLSIFSLNKVAEGYGLNLSGAKLTWEDLQDIYRQNGAASSIRFDGSGDYLSVADSNDWNLAAEDFTIDTWVNFNDFNASQVFVSSWSGQGDQRGFEFYYGKDVGLAFAFSTTGTDSMSKKVSWAPSANNWYHLAVTRQGNSLLFFVNGAQVGAAQDMTGYTIFDSSAPLLVGTAVNYLGERVGFLNGNIDGLRISKGISRWSQSFTPEKVREIPDSYTKLYLHTDSVRPVMDVSGNARPVTVYGNTQADSSSFAQQSNFTPRVIAHINGNHYVVITGITSDTITYMDPGIGADKQNETLTVTKDGFMKVWKGNVTLESSKLQSVAGYQNKVLSATQTQQIRGAFWGSILGLIGSIFVWIPFLNPLGLALTAISAVISGIEGDWISAISSIVTLGIAPNGLGGFFKDVFHGLTNALGGLGQVFNAVGGFVSNVYSAVTGFSNAMVNGIGGFLHGALGVSSKIAANIASTAVSVGLNFGVSRGLETLGVSPQIAGFLGSLTAGAVIGGFKATDVTKGITQAVNIQQSVSNVITLTNVGRLGLELGLDSSFTNIIGLSIAAIQGQIIQNPQTTLDLAFSKIMPQLSSSLAQYGMDKLGTSLGIDSRLSSLIGSPISGAIGAGFQGGVNVGQDIIAAINDGLLRGVASLGINYATQEAGLDPLTGALASRAITGAIAGLFQVPQPNPNQDPNNPNDDFLTPHNIFEGVFQAFYDSALNFGRLGITGTDSWSQAQYLQRVNNFSNIMLERGFGQAIEDSATQILTEDSISSILRTVNPVTLKFFQSVKEFFDYKNSNNQFETVVINGKTYKKLLLSNGDYQIFTEDKKDVFEIKRGSQILRGTFAKGNDGEWGLRTGTITVHHPNGVTTTSLVEDGKRTNVDIFNPNKLLSETPDFSIKLNSDQVEIDMDSDGNLVNGLLQNNETGEGFVIKDSKLASYLAGVPLSSDFEQQFMAQYGIGSTDITRPTTYENFVNDYPELTIDNSALPEGLSLKSDSRYLDQFIEGATKLSNIKKVAEMVNALEAQMGGARLERVVRIVNGEAREYVKVLGQQNNFFKVAGRWYRIDNPAVAKYFSSSAAFAGKLTQGVGMTASIVIAQNVLDRVKNGEDIFNIDFGVDAAVDLSVAIGTGAVAAATTAALVGAGFVSAAPIVVAGTTIAIGYGLTVLADRFIDELQIKEWLSQRASYLFNAG